METVAVQQSSEGAILALIGLLSLLISAVIITLFKMIADERKRSDKKDEAFLKSIDANTKSNKEIAEATKKTAKEAEKRNGHLAELAIENTEKLMQALTHITNQDITEQHVKHQTVDKKD